MSETLNCPFDDPLKYSYTTNEIEISGGKAKLKLQQADIDFTENFLSSTGFTWDNLKAEFLGNPDYLIQQIYKRPNDAVAYASFTNNENLSWGDGTLTGTLSGGASVGSGVLNLTGDANCDWNHNNIATIVQKGCIRIRFRPLYTGAPASVQNLFWANNNTQNRIMMRINGSQMQCYVYDNTATLICNISFSFPSTQNTIYEAEFNFDATGGTHRCFIDGDLKDTDTGIGTRSASLNFMRCGGDSSGHNIDILDVLVFDDVQHTANYTPDWTNIYEYDYLGSAVILPEMEHIGEGTIKLFNSFSTVENGSPRYTLQIGRSGNYLYWNGSSWTVSDGTYTQANDASTFNTNCGSLPVDGENYGQFKIIFPDTNTQSSVESLIASMNVDIGYLQTNPYGKILTGFRTDELEGFLETATKNGSDEIKYILENDGDYYYWNGSAWTTGNLIYSNSATASEIHANKSFLVSAASLWYVYWFLHSNDGTSTPELDNLQILYSFGGEEQETRNTCIVWADSFDNCNDASKNQIDVYLNVLQTKYKTRTIIMREHKIVTPDANGYWEVELIENENMEIGAKYIFAFSNGDIFERSVPNESQKNFYDLEA